MIDIPSFRKEYTSAFIAPPTLYVPIEFLMTALPELALKPFMFKTSLFKSVTAFLHIHSPLRPL